jgi:hypothetical protein
MRNLLFLFAACISLLTAYAQETAIGGVYVYKAPLMGYNLIEQGKLDKTNVLAVGKTYSFPTESFEIMPPTNSDPVLLYFSNDLLVKIKGGAEFRVDGFSQNISNIESLPERVKTGESLLNISLMKGEAEFSINNSNTNSLTMLQTSLTSFGLPSGKYYVKAEEKMVLVYVVEGSADYYDNGTGDITKVSQGSVIGVIPFPEVGEEAKEQFGDKMIKSIKKIKPEDLKKYTASVSSLSEISQGSMFIVVDKKPLGVRLK